MMAGLWGRIWRHSTGRYAAALLLTGFAALLRRVLHPWLGPIAPFIFFYPALIAAALFGGVGPGAVSLFAGVVLSVFFIYPYGQLGVTNPANFTSLAAFLGVQVCILFTAAEARRSRNELEKELAIQARLGQVLKAAGMSYWNWDLNSGRSGWTEAGDAPEEDVAGLPPGAFRGTFQSFLGRVHPNDRTQTRRVIDEAIVAGVLYQVEFRTRRADGEERWTSAMGQAVIQAGQSVYHVGVGTDVTERRLRDQDRRLLAAIVSSSNDAIISKDLEGRITSWNAAAQKLFGYLESEAVGQSITLLLPEDRMDDVAAILDRIRRGERVEHFETRRRRRDGVVLDVSLTISPIHDETGRVVGASKICRDITAAKAAERETHRTRDLYLGMLGHDLRNPLNTVVYSLYSLEKVASDSARPFLERISRANERMARMIEQLLDFTRARLGNGIPLEPRQSDLAAICGTVLDEFRVRYGDRLQCSVPSEVPGCWDSDRFSQLLGNLLANAFEHGSPQAPVRVVLQNDAQGISLRVSNLGPAIPEDLRRRIFEPFGKGTGAGRSRGLGLGLYIVHEIVRSHRGTIQLTSDPDETSFLVRLPYERSAPGPSPR